MPRLDRVELKKRLEFSERRRTLLQRMLARRTLEEDTFLWSIADLMTLLLIFFVLFYAHVADRKVPKEHGPPQEPSPVKMEQTATWDASSVPLVQDADYQLAEQQDTIEEITDQRDESLEHLRHEIMSALDENEYGALSARWDESRLVFVLGERITFNVGEAKLLEGFKPILRRVASAIASKQGYQVVVSGHTDNTPIYTERFPSNWELSAARAVSVARFLIANGVDPHRVSIQGHSSYQPLFTNNSPERKQANRRVEIALVGEERETTL